MRVRHLVCVAPPRLGGMGAAALRWVEALQERGHQTELVVPATPGFQPTHPLIRPWPVAVAWGNGAVLGKRKELWEGIDLLHLHLPFYGVQEFLLATRPPKPCVATFHMDAVQTGLLGVAIRAHQRLLQPFLFRYVDRFFASSLDYVAVSSAASIWRRSPERWQELPFFPGHVATPSRLRAPGPELGALFVSVLDRAHLFKGLPVLLRALARVERVRLTVVGDGDARSSFEEEARRYGVAERVTFAGRLSDEALRVAYQAADVVVSPSTSAAEAFGLVALEAQASGTPVIASRLPGVRTVVRDGETGLLVAPGSAEELAAALERLRDDAALRQSLGRRALAWAEERFAKGRLVTELEQAYADVLCASR